MLWCECVGDWVTAGLSWLK